MKVTGKDNWELLMLLVCTLIMLGFLLAVTLMIGEVVGMVREAVRPD